MSADSNPARSAAAEADYIAAETRRLRGYDKARELGLAAGYSAGARYFDGNADEATYRRVLEGIYAGDPAIYDTFPDAPPSGQAPGQQSTYEEAYYAALVHEIAERAAYMLSDDDDDDEDPRTLLSDEPPYGSFPEERDGSDLIGAPYEQASAEQAARAKAR